MRGGGGGADLHDDALQRARLTVTIQQLRRQERLPAGELSERFDLETELRLRRASNPIGVAELVECTGRHPRGADEEAAGKGAQRLIDTRARPEIRWIDRRDGAGAAIEAPVAQRVLALDLQIGAADERLDGAADRVAIAPGRAFDDEFEPDADWSLKDRHAVFRRCDRLRRITGGTGEAEEGDHRPVRRWPAESAQQRRQIRGADDSIAVDVGVRASDRAEQIRDQGGDIRAIAPAVTIRVARQRGGRGSNDGDRQQQGGNERADHPTKQKFI